MASEEEVPEVLEEVPEEGSEVPPEVPTAPPKRGRGRPRKDPNAPPKPKKQPVEVRQEVEAPQRTGVDSILYLFKQREIEERQRKSEQHKQMLGL